MKIFIGADHGGFKLKNKLKEFLEENYEVEDVGAFEFKKRDDYPDYVTKLVKGVKKENTKGVLVCSSGVGMAIAANKFSGIRAFNACSAKLAVNSRKKNNTNVICFGEKYTSFKKAKKILKKWLETEFTNKKRHKRRIKKIKDYE